MKENIILTLATSEEFKRESNCSELTHEEFKDYLRNNFNLEDLQQMLAEILR